MSRKKSYLTVTDQFCGAGGSSQGVRNVATKNRGGLEVKLALNHWKLAIETHNTNFPDTMHDCTDISACDPRRYPSTDILITSPECTNHSLAKGKKVVKKQMDLFDAGKQDAAAERSRATMWDVPRFAEYHGYNIIVVENVVDARNWVMFDSWLHAMHSLGYKHKCCYINSMHCHPTPQSRDRMYVVFWKAGNKAPQLDFRPKAFCPKCGNDVEAIQTWKSPDKKYGKYRQQYIYQCPVHAYAVEPYYYAALNCIDWTDLGTLIRDRQKPLSPNTIRRIEYGLKKYGSQPMQIVNYSPGYARNIFDSTGAMTTNDHHALLTPFILHAAYGSEARGVVRPVQDPTFTHTTVPSQAVVVPPFIIKGEHTTQDGYTRPVFDTIQTQTVRQSMALIAPPMLVELNRTGKSKPVTAPASTFTAGGVNQGLVSPQSWNSFIASYYSTGHRLSHFTDELGSQTAVERHSLITYETPKIEDCYYRMLKPHEIKLAMAFAADYRILGSGKDQVKQCGNAVTPPVMEWLIERCVESLN